MEDVVEAPYLSLISLCLHWVLSLRHLRRVLSEMGEGGARSEDWRHKKATYHNVFLISISMLFFFFFKRGVLVCFYFVPDFFFSKSRT